MLQFLNLKKHLSDNRLPALCLCGNDRWLQRKSIANVCEAYSIANDGFSMDNLDAPAYKEVELACCTPSMFCPTKLVVVENFVFPQGKQQAETVANLSRLVAQCDGSFCLVFLSDNVSAFDKIDGLVVVNCDKLDNENVAKWVVSYGKRRGVEISMACARKMSEYCLQDMSRVETETQKLIDYGEVTLESVELLVHKDTEYVVFNLSKTISSKNAQAALELYKGLVAAGEEARGLFGLLYATYRRAYYVKISDLSTEKLAEMLGVKPYAVEKSREIANLYKPMQIKRILDCFESAYVKLKAFLDENEVMTTLIMQLVSM